MINAKGLSKYYGGKMAIENVSFSIDEGEIVGLLGLNGAGKSTILKILGCFLMPSSGSATIGGYTVEDDPHGIRGIIGYLPDRPPLYSEMPVRSFLGYVARLKDVPSDKLEEYVSNAIKRTNLEDVADTPVGSLSHGFQQRVGIAQAIVHKPKVLILDEPINGLDPVQIVEMRDLILSLRGQHTVILSSHILSEITKTCDRILIVDKGRLVAEGNQGDLVAGGGKVTNFNMECEVRGGSGLTQTLAGLRGVSSVDEEAGASSSLLRISLDDDVRSEVAKTIVNSGAELLEMSRQGSDLEQLFMKFVRS